MRILVLKKHWLPQIPATPAGTEVKKPITPAPLSEKVSTPRTPLERSSSRLRRERLAPHPRNEDIKPGPLSYKMNMLKRAPVWEDLPPARRGQRRRNISSPDTKPSPKRRVVRRAAKQTPSDLQKRLWPRRCVKPDVQNPKMSIIGMEPLDSTSSAYREGYLGMTSVVADFEDLSRANLDRLRGEQEVELEEWDGRSGGSRIRSRRVAERTSRDEEGERKDVGTQTNFRVRIWMMPTRLLPLRKYLERQQKKNGSGGPS